MNALIIGPLGQDGSFLTDILLEKKYNLTGIVKPDTSNERINLFAHNKNIKIKKIDILNKNEFKTFLSKSSFDEIYNFSGVTNVFDPYKDSTHTLESIILPSSIILDYIKENKNIKFFTSSSSLIYKNNTTISLKEDAFKQPHFPYGIAKLAVDDLLKQYRTQYNLFCCSGIFFNHDSERRGNGFFTKKVVKTVVEILRNKQKRLRLGNINVYKDMGYAKDFAISSYLMLQNSVPDSYNVGTGSYVFLKDFVSECFRYVNLDWEKFTDYDFTDIPQLGILANTEKIYKSLNWTSQHNMKDIINIMMKHELNNLE